MMILKKGRVRLGRSPANTVDTSVLHTTGYTQNVITYDKMMKGKEDVTNLRFAMLSKCTIKAINYVL